MDWSSFEQTLFDEALVLALSVMRLHPQERFYALAFTNLYAEKDGPIYLPMLALNSEAADVQQGGKRDSIPGSLWDIRWSPADWHWPELIVSSAAWTAAEEALIAEANRSDVQHWLQTEQAYKTALVRVSKRLRQALRKSDVAPLLTKDFIVFIDDDDGDEPISLTRRCLTEKEFKRLFPEQDEAMLEALRVASLPVPAQVAYHVACLQGLAAPELGLTAELARLLVEEAENKLKTLGEAAVPALLSLLEHPAHRWRAAMLLGNIGSAREDVRQALRHHASTAVNEKGQAARDAQSGRAWCATALGHLGDAPWLLAQCCVLPDEIVVDGLAAPLRSFANDGVRPLPLNYRPVEQALQQHPQLTALFEKELNPGNGFVTLRAEGIDEALRGLQSPHVVLRRHAACLLSERALGAKAGARIVPALVQALQTDDDADVRQLCVLALESWKKQAAPYRDLAVHIAANDVDESVRQFAQQWLETLGG